MIGYIALTGLKEKIKLVQKRFNRHIITFIIASFITLIIFGLLIRYYLELLKVSRLEKKLAVVGRNTSNVIHEIKNMAAGIVYYPEFIKDKLEKGDREEVNELLKEMTYNTHRLLHFTQNTLSFLKGENLEIKLNRIKAREFIDKFVSHISKDPRMANINIEYNNGYDGWIDIDEDYFENVLSNIFYNIEQSTNGRCDVFIEDKQDGDDYVLKIKNTNSRIPENIKLFEFGQTGKYRGSGIGLYVARLIVEAHKGKINGYNVEDGVVFEIRLPV